MPYVGHRWMLGVLALAALAVGPLSAERYSFRAYGEREGLSSSEVRMIAQDAAGYLWVTTRHGLFRFDGTRFEREPALADLDVNWLHASTYGSLWIWTQDRLIRWRDGKAVTVMAGEQTGRYGRQAIGSGPDGELWLLADGSRLERMSPKSLKREVVRVEPDGLRSVLPLADGSVITGCGDGLCSWRSGVWQREQAPRQHYQRLFAAPDGAIYARGHGRIVRKRPGEGAFTDITHGLAAVDSQKVAPDLAMDRQRRLLTNTESGIARLEGDRWQVISSEQGLVDQVVRSLFVDRDGGVWLGTLNGLNRWRGGGAWRMLGTADGLPRGRILAVTQDRRGEVWINSPSNGIYRGRRVQGRWQFHLVPELPWSRAALLSLDRDGSLWLGPMTGGLLRYDPSTRQAKPVPGMDPAGVVRGLALDRQGRVMVVSSRGFFREKQPGVLEGLLPGRDLSTFGEDESGATWVSGDGYLARLREDRWEVLNPEWLRQRIGAILAGQDKRFWLASFSQDGLLVQPPADSQFPPDMGTRLRPNVFLFFLKYDRRGCLWAGTSGGVAALDQGRWWHYGQPQVLAWGQGSGAWFDTDGTAWFATSGGLVHYTPHIDPGYPGPPQIVLNGASSRAGSLELASGPAVRVDDADIQLHYSVLCTRLDAPPQVRYRLNRNDPWRAAPASPITFPHLPPGNYRIELAAQGLNGTWTPEPPVFAFRVLPHWWQTWWSAWLLVGAVTGLTALALLRRLRREQEAHQRRLREMVDRYPGVVVLLDLEGRFVLTNRRFEEYTRQSPGGAIGRHPRDVMRPENAANVERHLERARASNTFTLSEYREEYELPTGKVVFDIRAFPVHGLRGEVEAICVFATDVTERWRLERESKEAAQRYAAFVRQSSEGIWRVEYEPPVPIHLPAKEFGDTCYARAVVREANAVAASFMSTEPELLVGKRYAELVNRRLPEIRRADRLWYERNFQLHDYELVTVDAHGNQRTFLSNTVGIVEDGCLVRSWSTQREVTEQRRLEAIVTSTARGVAAETGARFFDSLTEHLVRSLRADRAVAGELLPGTKRVKVLAGWAGAAIPTGREFDLSPGTPGWTVLETGKPFYWRLHDPFPSIELPGVDLAAWLGATHIVMPLKSAGTVIGFLTVSWAEPTELKEAQPVLETFAARAGAELERLRAEREVLHYQEQLRALTARTQKVAEQERARLARQIHDELGQHLTAIKIGLSGVASRVRKGESEPAQAQMAEVGKLADETVQIVRGLATQLRPPVLDQLGLAAAIRWQARELEQRLGVPVACELQQVVVDTETSTAAFRILQESMTNVMRHAQARSVSIELRLDAGVLVLRVSDDGVGFVPGPGGGSLGLIGMQERAAALGGSVIVRSAPGEGTTVEARLPVPAEEVCL